MILDGMSSQACPVNAVVSQGFISEPSLSLLDITAFPDDIICNTIIYGNNINLYFNHVQASGLGQPLRLASELKSDLQHAVDRGRKWFADFNAGKIQVVFFLYGTNSSDAVEVKMAGSVLDEKSFLKMLKFSFYSK